MFDLLYGGHPTCDLSFCSNLNTLCVCVCVYMQSRYSVVPGPSPGRPEALRLSSPPTTTTRTTLTNQLPDRTTAIPTTLVRLIPSFSPEV